MRIGTLACTPRPDQEDVALITGEGRLMHHRDVGRLLSRFDTPRDEEFVAVGSVVGAVLAKDIGVGPGNRWRVG